MGKVLKLIGVIVAIPFLAASLLIIDWFVYPFTSDKPNFSDVEEAFSRLEFPADWKEVESRESRGIAGRGCDPFNSSGCFSKSKSFKTGTDSDGQINEMLKQAGCTSVSKLDISSTTDIKPNLRYDCRVSGGIGLTASSDNNLGKVYVGARSF